MTQMRYKIMELLILEILIGFVNSLNAGLILYDYFLSPSDYFLKISFFFWWGGGGGWDSVSIRMDPDQTRSFIGS